MMLCPETVSFGSCIWISFWVSCVKCNSSLLCWAVDWLPVWTPSTRGIIAVVLCSVFDRPAAQWAPRILLSPLSWCCCGLEITCPTCPASKEGGENLSSGPSACTTGTFPMEPLPQSPPLSLKSFSCCCRFVCFFFWFCCFGFIPVVGLETQSY